MVKQSALLVTLMIGLAACPPAGTGPRGRGGGGDGGAAINPDGCGTINSGRVGRKLYAFLQASAELDRASIDLDNAVAGACRKMATSLGVPTEGTTKEVCNRAATELQANLQISVKSEKRLVTRYAPAECHTEIDFAAGVVAQCEARASADIGVRCDGRCSGTCNGACSGSTAGGQCNGTCDGTCRGSCDGFANVDASAECKASAEVRANLHTECTEPKVEVVQQDVTIVDATKFNKAMEAINGGLPQILRAERKLALAAKAVANWIATGASLADATGEILGELGERGLCVGMQLAAVVAASAHIEARLSVSIEVSAQVSASAGATAR